MFDCCSGNKANELADGADGLAVHKAILSDAGINADDIKGLDVGHYQILEPITQTKVIEIEKEIIEEKIVNVPEVHVVDEFVEVEVPVVKYKPIYKKKEVVVEKHRHVPKIVYEDKIVEVPQIKYVEKEVDVPQIVVKEKIVEEPKVMVVERVIPVLRVKKADHATEIDGAGEEFLSENYKSNVDDGLKGMVLFIYISYVPI